jgi:hypothetical protein
MKPNALAIFNACRYGLANRLRWLEPNLQENCSNESGIMRRNSWAESSVERRARAMAALARIGLRVHLCAP